MAGPWEQHDGHEGGQNRILIDFDLIWGPYFEICFGTEPWNFNFSSGLSKTLFVPNIMSKLARLRLLNPGFRIGGIAKTFFQMNVF